MHFWIYGLRKTSLDKFLKSPVSGGFSNSNIVNGPKHSVSPNDSTFTIIINQYEGNSVGETLS